MTTFLSARRDITLDQAVAAGRPFREITAPTITAVVGAQAAPLAAGAVAVAPEAVSAVALRIAVQAPRATAIATEMSAAEVGLSVGAVGATAKVASEIPQGSFSIFSWAGYPASLPKPTGIFRLLEGAEYDAARKAANAANRAMHKADPTLAGKQIHEVKPVKFGGNPTEPANKIPLQPKEHTEITTWWNRLMRDIAQ
jgi:hypothetical protein